MFKNQYILTDKIITTPKNSNYTKIFNYSLITSEEINVFRSKNNNITLIGYTFHCYNTNTEQEIVEHLSKLKNEELLSEIDKLCGHFILFIYDKYLKIYTDACASFKVFYAKGNKYTFIGSDPKTLCKLYKFKLHTEKDKQHFYESNFFLKNNTKIGHHTRYKNMYQLVSNHFLSVKNLKSRRIFPRKMRKEISIKNASNKLIPIFDNILQQIEKKYTIFTSITAGYDSRLLMATTKKFSKKTQYYTFRLPNQPENFIDYTIPKQICNTLNLNYSSIKIKNIEKTTLKKLQSIYDLPKKRPFEQYKDIFTQNIKPNILLVGFVSEVTKNYLERVRINNGKDAVRATHYPDNRYLEKYYQNWLNHNKQEIKKLKYEILDFIHWEQDITNFAGQNTYYAHHYVNLFSIFNSREILNIMLSVSSKERDGKEPKLFKYLIKEMWPDLINYPFNPTLKEKSILFMKKMKIYPFYKYLQIKLTNHGKV